MKPTTLPEALFYPFHLCHEETLAKLFLRFSKVHFRDFMSLQLTSMAGMTAYPDRMGDRYPELIAAGTLVQGYNVSGLLPGDVETAIDCDLKDPEWRRLFEEALRGERRFRLGLFGNDQAPRYDKVGWTAVPYTVAMVKEFCAPSASNEIAWDYGLALVKTSAALVYTYRLALVHGLQAATDSPAHFALFDLMLRRENLAVGNHLVVRKGY